MIDTARWMANLHGDLRLDQIAMPGSHDAGVYGVGEMTAKKSAISWAKCQYSNFGGQAEAGSGFFDLRVFVQKIEEKKTILGKLPARAQLRAGHFMCARAGGGRRFRIRVRFIEAARRSQ